MMIYAVIMAGGGGTRFWPLSRKRNPKQLLSLSGDKPMVTETASRLNRVTDSENIYVITNALQAEKTAIAVSSVLSKDNIISEPCAKNTSAAIAYSALKILKTRGDGVIIVSPADAYIKDEESYAEALKLAAQAAHDSDGIVTLGITPSFPATGYGYIRAQKSGNKVERALGFTEKPDLERAQHYYKSGEYFWNSGVFVFKASVMLKNIERFLPALYSTLMSVYDDLGTPAEERAIAKIYPELPSISIDYGVMERAERVYVVPGDFGWSDVGSWDMLGAVRKEDDFGNVTSGDVILLDSKNTYAVSDGTLVAAIGVDNLVIVRTPDALLVCDKDKAQQVKEITEILEKNGRTDLL